MLNATIPTNQTKMFLDPMGPVGIARYDILKYPQFDKLTEQQNGYFWRPQEVDCTPDGKDFRKMSTSEQHLYISNIRRQIVLDSEQGRSPSTILAPLASLPEIEAWIHTWNYFETIHSRSYTHIIRGVFANPTEVFDTIMDAPEIKKCAESINRYYSDLDQWNIMNRTGDPRYNIYSHKKALWMCLNSVNALEGIRFYVSFACSWAFAELKKMEGSAKIIKFISRDENLHLAGTQQLLKLLPQDDSDFIKIREECRDGVRSMFVEVVDQEIDWANYLFKEGSIIGLNADILTEYVQWIAHKRMLAVGVESPYKGGSNPLPWTQRWIGGADVQVAPQEVNITSYTVGGFKKDVDEDTFAGFEL